MDCLFTLVANALCLISPSQLTLRADISTQVAGDFHYSWAGVDYHGGHVGRVQLEMPILVGRHFSLDAGYLHQSLLDTGKDRGEERVLLGLTWRPFGGAR